MWTIVIIVIVFVIGKFFYDKNQKDIKVKKEGGMENKYKILVNHIKSGDSRTRIYQITGDCISLGISNIGGTTIYNLVQGFGKLIVEWKMESPIFGKHRLEWTFHEFDDQNKMMERIANDLSIYQANVMSGLGYNENEELK